MPVAKNSIVFARIVPSELNIVTTENNNVIDLALASQLKDASGTDIWQIKRHGFGSDTDISLALGWGEFSDHFYGGGEKDFAVSQVAGRRFTMIGISGEYANGVPQSTSQLTHMADRGNNSNKISGVSVLNDVIDSVVMDLGLPHEAWDSCSYMNVVNNLQDVHTLEDVMRVQGKLQQSCSLTMSQLVHEISSNFDENMGYTANVSSSSLYKLYSDGLDAAIHSAMDLSGNQKNALHDLVLSVMFKNSTPGVRNVEFRIHMLVGINMDGNGDLDGKPRTGTITSLTSQVLELNGTQV